jgi:hypothetical protein
VDPAEEGGRDHTLFACFGLAAMGSLAFLGVRTFWLGARRGKDGAGGSDVPAAEVELLAQEKDAAYPQAKNSRTEYVDLEDQDPIITDADPRAPLGGPAWASPAAAARNLPL